jgi:hypothetical protein
MELHLHWRVLEQFSGLCELAQVPQHVVALVRDAQPELLLAVAEHLEDGAVGVGRYRRVNWREFLASCFDHFVLLLLVTGRWWLLDLRQLQYAVNAQDSEAAGHYDPLQNLRFIVERVELLLLLQESKVALQLPLKVTRQHRDMLVGGGAVRCIVGRDNLLEDVRVDGEDVGARHVKQIISHVWAIANHMHLRITALFSKKKKESSAS